MMSDIESPWLGLKSYPEGHKIYGRDKEINELSQKILYNTQTVIYGKSGIGKSSILNAGVFPILRKNNYFPVYIRLVHDDCISYCSQVIAAVVESLGKLRVEDLGAPDDKIYKEVQGYVKEVVGRYDESCPEGLWEFFHRHEFCYQLNEEEGEQTVAPVLIFDQFEEIFTLQKDNDKMHDFFNELASLLNNICPQYLLRDTVEVSNREVVTHARGSLIKKGLVRKTTKLDYIDETNVRLVLSLREDYLSYLERNIIHIPSLKHNRYCLLPLSEEQAVDIIMKPVPGLIDIDVAKSIICKVTGANHDEFEVGDDKPELEVDSAILSLFLTELYKKKPLDELKLTMEMVDSLGENIIADFYKKVTSPLKISQEVVHYLEDKLLTESGKRDNIPLSRALNIISEKTLEYLKEERLIHEFPWNDEMRIEYMHDILCETVKKNRDERLERLEREKREREIRSMRHKNAITIFGVVVLIAVIVFYYLYAMLPVTERYASVTKVFGQFKGVEHLTKQEASYRSYHFVLKKKGLGTKIYSSMECRSAYDSLTTSHSMSIYLIPGNIASAQEYLNEGVVESLQSVCQWEFVTDVKCEKVIQERAYNKKSDLIYAFNYNPVAVAIKAKVNSKDENSSSKLKLEGRVDIENVVIGSYVDEQGLPMEIMNDGYRFVRISYNDSGYDTLVEYFDKDGNPATNADGAYQTYYEYNEHGQVSSMISLNKYGKRMIDRAGNCGMIYTYDGYNVVESLSVDEFGREKAVDDNGYSQILSKYDEHGRMVEVRFLCHGKPVDLEGHFYRQESIYGENSTTLLMYNAKDSLILREYILFNEQGQQLLYESNKMYLVSKYDNSGEIIYHKEISFEDGDTTGVFTYEKTNNIKIRRYEGEMYINYVNVKEYDDRGRILDDSYYDLDGVTPYEDDANWHRIHYAYEENDYERTSIWKQEVDTTIYYNVDGIDKMEVRKKFPARYADIYERYNSDGKGQILQRKLDKYDNVIKECYSNTANVYYFVNARTNEMSNEALGMLTIYGFPTDNFRYYSSKTWQQCNENAEIVSDDSYRLPNIYSGERSKTGVFIEVIENGRSFHGVLLESDSDVYLGGENYSCKAINQSDNVVYLNLTTMRIGTMDLNTDEAFWTLYNCGITEEEFDIYLEHYRKYKDSVSNE